MDDVAEPDSRIFPCATPAWPGQEHPGLGIGEADHAHAVPRGATPGARRADAHHPSRYHIAFIGGGQFFFLDPELQGRFEAIRDVLAPLDLSEAAWKMERGEVCWGDGEPVEWIPEDVAVPASDRFFAYLGSREYQEPRMAAREAAQSRGIVLEPTQRTS